MTGCWAARTLDVAGMHLAAHDCRASVPIVLCLQSQGARLSCAACVPAALRAGVWRHTACHRAVRVARAAELQVQYCCSYRRRNCVRRSLRAPLPTQPPPTALPYRAIRTPLQVVLYGVGTGATVEFAFTVMVSVRGAQGSSTRTACRGQEQPHAERLTAACSARMAERSVRDEAGMRAAARWIHMARRTRGGQHPSPCTRASAAPEPASSPRSLLQVCASMIVNVLLARVLLRLCWNAELMATGAFFGDKGPNYDDERVRAAASHHRCRCRPGPFSSCCTRWA